MRQVLPSKAQVRLGFEEQLEEIHHLAPAGTVTAVGVDRRPKASEITLKAGGKDGVRTGEGGRMQASRCLRLVTLARCSGRS